MSIPEKSLKSRIKVAATAEPIRQAGTIVVSACPEQPPQLPSVHRSDTVAHLLKRSGGEGHAAAHQKRQDGCAPEESPAGTLKTDRSNAAVNNEAELTCWVLVLFFLLVWMCMLPDEVSNARKMATGYFTVLHDELDFPGTLQEKAFKENRLAWDYEDPLHDYENALIHHRKALDLFSRAHFNSSAICWQEVDLAKCLIKLGRYSEAEPGLEKVVRTAKEPRLNYYHKEASELLQQCREKQANSRLEKKKAET